MLTSEIKVGSIVKCIDCENYSNLLIKGKIYRVLRVTNGFIYINNEQNTNFGFFHDRFELIDSKAAEVLYGDIND